MMKEILQQMACLPQLDKTMDSTIRTRFAPSPTGFLHVGSARTALFAFLYARKHQGQFILRIEDTDKDREVEGAIGHIMESLKWLQITWDEGLDCGGEFAPYIQSERLEIYKKYAEKLIASGFAYPDPYSKDEVEIFRAQSEENKQPFLYRNYRPTTIDEWDGTKALRFKTPFIKRYTWHDMVRGELSAGEEALDDFILIKADGYPTYNFAHVIDDIEMNITHVMRGEEFISSTPKFLSLYDALELIPPVFATLPPILGELGTKKLSKRDGAKDVLDYRTQGYLPEALVNFLALQGWNPGTEQELFSMEELIAQFDLSKIQKSGAMFNEEKLFFITKLWMRKLSDIDYCTVGKLTAPAWKCSPDDTSSETLLKTIPLLKERAHTFTQAQELLEGELLFFFTRPSLDKTVLLSKEAELTKGHIKKHLGEIKNILISETEPFESVQSVKDALMPYADTISKEDGGRGIVLWPLRYSLSGRDASPDPFTCIYILGISESIFRIEQALAILT
jgi:glutamyl-tRNA synthetase